ncbi:uncharacterized protein UTRI_06563 [Ustilago trichophora]|uniref:Uncharacterized protein n=1 Tax=Ustilago trichophora TaxID=86804 RepID=A0A5C3ELE6_9BASI|nr:uncharacterized protein UTRI_06563 [Ustilago trichophora]
MAKKVWTKKQDGDQMMLSKYVMIMCKQAERELVWKEPATAAKQRKKWQNEKQQQEGGAAQPSPVAADDGNKAACDDNEGALTLLASAAPPSVPQEADELDDGEPLSSINDSNKDPYGFYATLPIASSSRFMLSVLSCSACIVVFMVSVSEVSVELVHKPVCTPSQQVLPSD